MDEIKLDGSQKDLEILDLKENFRKMSEKYLSPETKYNSQLNDVWRYLIRELTKLKVPLNPLQSPEINRKQDFLDADLLNMFQSTARKFPKQFRFIGKDQEKSVGRHSADNKCDQSTLKSLLTSRYVYVYVFKYICICICIYIFRNSDNTCFYIYICTSISINEVNLLSKCYLLLDCLSTKWMNLVLP
jgi:hypothetical protein